MRETVSQDDLALLRELLDALVSGLDDEAPPEDAAGVELRALEMQAPFTWHVPPEFVAELPAALARRGDQIAADLLVAMERLAPSLLAGAAASASRQLQAAGVRSAWADEIGGAVVAEASVLAAPDVAAEIWHAVLRRPGRDEEQSFVVLVRHESCGAVIVGAMLALPNDRGAARDLSRDRALEDRPTQPLRVPELTERLRAALDHMERHDVELDAEAGRVLPLLERALTGRVGGFARPSTGPPVDLLGDDADLLDAAERFGDVGPLDADDLLDDEAEDEEQELRVQADDLVEAFAAALEDDADADTTLREHGPFVAHCMLEWKIGYADRRLVTWTLGDLREFLLDWFPRKVTADDETITIAADAVTAFLGFLAREERLDAPVPLASLEAAVARLRTRFERACRDPRNWGLAKTMAAQMEADGVDPRDEAGVQRWIAEFNQSPWEDREAVLGPPAERMLAAAGALPRRAPAAKRARRKAARRARKRNRR
jgi:hypothetical protein